jgi:hypothetical protein
VGRRLVSTRRGVAAIVTLSTGRAALRWAIRLRLPA